MRIRTIKPEFFKHDGVAALPALHRILLVGIWCCADGWGRLEDRPARLKVEVLPYDDINIEPMLSDLSKAGFIVRYEVDGQRLIEVPNFRTHQNIQGREFAISSKYPSINDGSIFHSTGSDAEVPTHSRGSDGKERKGKERTPEVVSLPASLDTEAFRAAWELFAIHRKEIRKKLTPTASRLTLEALEKMGEQRAIAAIKHTIEKGWQGIREDDSASRFTQPRKPDQPTLKI